MKEDIKRENLIRTMQSHRICVIVPTFNNDCTIRRVISDLLNYSSDIIVVNDGSTDSTDKILEEFSTSIHIVTLDNNQGKGAALKHGFRRALELGYSYAITIDSDGQHYPSDIPLFVRAIVENPGALIVGQRNLKDVDINGKSAFANKFSNFWFTVQTGIKLKDTQTGYRAYPLKSINGINFLTNRYEAELELLVLLAWKGVKIVSIPISVYYPPQAERVSHFKPALDFTRISILNTILCFGCLLYGFPSIFYSRIKNRRFFNGEFIPFTRKKHEKREVNITFGRLCRSLYALSHFMFWSVLIFKPYVFINFKLFKPTENKKLKLHRKLYRISSFFSRHFPGGKAAIDNPNIEDFRKPALIICNHQSYLDLPIILSLCPKLIFLTNDWVWNNKFFGEIVRQADFLPVSAGMDIIIPHLKTLKDKGYSIVVFPEGTRSEDCKINRFHQGAFLLAQELDMDILPIVIHGAGNYLAKHDRLFRKNPQTLRILCRKPIQKEDGIPLRKQASNFRKIMSGEYENMVTELATPIYWKSFVFYKYAYRGWAVSFRAKSELKLLKEVTMEFADIDKPVYFVNAGVGALPLTCALANNKTEVFSFIENIEDFNVATSTACLPANLHIVHTVWDNDYDVIPPGARVYVSAGSLRAKFKPFNPILINIQP